MGKLLTSIIGSLIFLFWAITLICNFSDYLKKSNNISKGNKLDSLKIQFLKKTAIFFIITLLLFGIVIFLNRVI